MASQFGNSSTSAPDGTGVWLGKVTRIDSGGGVHVQVGRQAGEGEYGPCLVVGTTTLSAGDSVAAAFVESSADDVIILGPVSDKNP